MSNFAGITGAPSFFVSGLRYLFSGATKSDLDGVVSDGNVKVNIPNPSARAALTGLYPNATFVDGQFPQPVGSFVYTVSPSKRTVDPSVAVTQNDYETGKIFKITVDSTVDAVPTVVPTYVWGNRMMIDQPSGTYTYHSLPSTSVATYLKSVNAANIFVGHDSTINAVAHFRDAGETLKANRASFPQLQVGEATLVVVPTGVNVGGTDKDVTPQLSSFNFFLIVREA